MPTAIDNRFGEWLRAARAQCGWSQVQLLEAVKALRPSARITQSYISALEKGIRSPSREIAAGLARALGRSEGEAVSLIVRLPPHEIAYRVDPDLREFVDNFDDMDPALQELAREQLRAIQRMHEHRRTTHGKRAE